MKTLFWNIIIIIFFASESNGSDWISWSGAQRNNKRTICQLGVIEIDSVVQIQGVITYFITENQTENKYWYWPWRSYNGYGNDGAIKNKLSAFHVFGNGPNEKRKKLYHNFSIIS